MISCTNTEIPTVSLIIYNEYRLSYFGFTAHHSSGGGINCPDNGLRSMALSAKPWPGCPQSVIHSGVTSLSAAYGIYLSTCPSPALVRQRPAAGTCTGLVRAGSNCGAAIPTPHAADTTACHPLAGMLIKHRTTRQTPCTKVNRNKCFKSPVWVPPLMDRQCLSLHKKIFVHNRT